MKITVTESMFRDQFRLHGRGNKFSYEALTALYEYLEELDREKENEYELDVIEICCEYTEYATALDAVYFYSFEINNELNEEEKEKEALNFLNDNTLVIIFSGGIIIQNF
jgi:hypothetical protein